MHDPRSAPKDAAHASSAAMSLYLFMFLSSFLPPCVFLFWLQPSLRAAAPMRAARAVAA
jgi:hypothetical protein